MRAKDVPVSDDGFTGLPVEKFSVEGAPANVRAWLEATVTAPLNRLMAPLNSILRRIFLSQLNMQVLEWRGYPPTSTNPAEWVSSLSGRCLGVIGPIYVRGLRGSTEEFVAEGAGLSTPAWTETNGNDGDRLRVTGQAGGLTSTQKYVIRWLAIGE